MWLVPIVLPWQRIRRRYKQTTLRILLELVKLHVARASIDDHSVALCRIDDVVVDDLNAALVTNALLEDTLSLDLSRRKRVDLRHVFLVTLDVDYHDASARALRYGVPIAVQVIDTQVLKKDARFGLAPDALVSLVHQDLLFLFLFVCGAWNGVQLRLEATVRYSVVLDLQVVLKIVVLTWAFNRNRRSLQLYDAIILDVHFSCESLNQCLIAVTIYIDRLRCKHFIVRAGRSVDQRSL